MCIDDLQNSKKEELICQRYKRESYRQILRERFIDGWTYEKILLRLYKDWEWYPERLKRRKRYALQVWCVKFCEYVERKMENDN